LDSLLFPEPKNALPAAHILVVDDIESNRDLLCRRLSKLGHHTQIATNGREALEFLDHSLVDLILLDVMMPEVDGYTALTLIKRSKRLCKIPVVMISAVMDFESIVRCIELGAEDYILKPFNSTILKARVNACLEKKRLRDQETAYLENLKREQARSERLLLNILPASIAQSLKDETKTIAEHYADVTVLFADIVGFTEFAAVRSPQDVLNCLNLIFSAFDRLVEIHQVEKIKTIGDAYMAVGGLTARPQNHTAAIANLALDMQQTIEDISQTLDQTLLLRIGISQGPVVAGVIGTQRLSYDLWGDTVNMASRMESHGLPGQIQMTATCRNRLDGRYEISDRGIIRVKGKGEVATLWLKSRLC
jgi:adenylate cyclase